MRQYVFLVVMLDYRSPGNYPYKDPAVIRYRNKVRFHRSYDQILY